MRATRKGFTITELIIGLVAGTILVMGVAAIMLMLFRGHRESREFMEATQRIDLIRLMAFDSRMARQINFPTGHSLDGSDPLSSGKYAEGSNEGYRCQFVALEVTDVNSGATQPYMVTWQSVRDVSSTDPTFRVECWRQPVNAQYEPIGTAELRVSQDGITEFEVYRRSARSLAITMQSSEGEESATIVMVTTARNMN